MILKVVNFIGSLCFLLYGMKLMSDGIQKSAGQKFQSVLAFMTGNRFIGLLTGCALTMIIQSSGATTVMLVSFVNAGLVSLEQSVGVIFGANIGTTVTAWIVALFGFNFKLETFAIPLFGCGFLLTLITRIKKEGLGTAIMGFGILFIGLGWLSSAFKDSNDVLIEFINTIHGIGPLCIVFAVVVGVFFTALIHSSSAMTAIVITIAAVEPSFWEFGAAMVIGSTIGSTIDSIMASFGTKPNAKRTALIHVMFNTSAAVLALIFFRPFLQLVDFLVPGTVQENVTYHIAMLNTAFKVIATIIFIPFVNQIAELTRHIIKERPDSESGEYTLEFSERLGIESPESCVFRAQNEIAMFSDNVVTMFDELQTGFLNCNEDFVEKGFVKIERLENFCDQMNEKLTQYLVRCTHLHLSDESKDNLALMMQLVGEMESMSDGCMNIASQLKKAIEKKLSFRQEDFARLLPYFELARQLLYFIYRNVATIQKLTPEQFAFAGELEQQIDNERKALKKIARKRLESGADVKSELLYMDIIRQIEKIGDRCFDVAGELR